MQLNLLIQLQRMMSVPFLFPLDNFIMLFHINCEYELFLSEFGEFLSFWPMLGLTVTLITLTVLDEECQCDITPSTMLIFDCSYRSSS